MNTTGLILFLLLLICSLGAFAYGIVNVFKVNKTKGQYLGYFKLTKKLLIIGATVAFTLMGSLLFIYLWNNINPNGREWASSIIGSLLFGFSLFIFVSFFITHYYGKGIEEKLDKWLFRFMILSFISAIIFMFVTFDGYAAYLNATKPLANGINFTQLKFNYPGSNNDGDFRIAWYAICILVGAVLAYFYSDHRMYMEYGKHGLLESTFLVALPAGIIGARLFYVIGQWNTEFASDPVSMFYVWDGGLTILGGALSGIVVGCLWFLWRNKGYNLLIATDMILPSILLAQAVGRWGNFFNCEVYGQAVNEAYFRWLPDIIFNNIHFNSYGGLIGANQVAVPLFLIEGGLNVLGFFLLSELLGKKLRRFTEFGDIACCYFIWYGLVRAILEPLRDKEYIMNDFWSWFWSLAFIVGGVVLIVSNHVIRTVIRKKQGKLIIKPTHFKEGLIVSIGLVSIFAICLALALVFIVNGEKVLAIPSEFSSSRYMFFMGLLLLSIAISSLIGFGVSFPKMIRGYRYKNNHE